MLTTFVLPTGDVIDSFDEELIELFDYGVDVKDVIRSAMEVWKDLYWSRKKAKEDIEDSLRNAVRENIIKPSLVYGAIHEDTKSRIEDTLVEMARLLYNEFDSFKKIRNYVDILERGWLGYDIVVEAV